MTRDETMSDNEQVQPSNVEAAQNRLQQFCLLAKTAHGQAILELVKQVLEAPGIYVFAELLGMPNVAELKTGLNAKYYKTLELFAYGTYKEYKQKQEDYIDLTPVMLKKLQQLTIVSMAVKRKCIKYDLLMEELEITVVRQLEDIIIEAIYAGKCVY
ncbi:COP9 signalosome complex subunit 7-like [Teleopsis dalmanni]|uniref:COP9 signalosome complex subunit 7-like n=1 Tax=Teleopsis dalmanni TaxID=139649 RepID=UPI0018CE08F7|nr:COP9 signalosome complex subunit 7-like [Teleopsis dalmanni]XP_037951280.1 COP9 signalosome complex subunit 7-like [Teleopsis dalmanni]